MRKATKSAPSTAERCPTCGEKIWPPGFDNCSACGAKEWGKPAPSPAEAVTCNCDRRRHGFLHQESCPKNSPASPAERMDDAEFERICANVVMLIPPITLVEKYRDEIRCRPQDDTKLIAEARRARESEAALRAESILPEMQAAQFGENVAEAKFKKAEEENERLATWGAAEQGAHLSWKASSHAAEARVKELLKIIEDAPHGGNCAGFPPRIIGGKWDTTACDCWKAAAALKEKP